jgi:hypothetical protein
MSTVSVSRVFGFYILSEMTYSLPLGLRTAGLDIFSAMHN